MQLDEFGRCRVLADANWLPLAFGADKSVVLYVPHAEDALVELASPSARYRESYLSALVDYQAEGRHLRLDRERLASDFDSYIDEMQAKADPASPRPAGRVPETTLWYVPTPSSSVVSGFATS